MTLYFLPHNVTQMNFFGELHFCNLFGISFSMVLERSQVYLNVIDFIIMLTFVPREKGLVEVLQK